jgi:hypothetical protein
VTARRNQRRDGFRVETDWLKFLELLGAPSEWYGLRPWCYMRRDNHFHLGLETTEPNLSRAMQWLNVSCSVWFNRRHHRSGPLFQGRFKAVLVNWQSWGLEVTRYVHLNPVRVDQRGLSKVATERNRRRVARRDALNNRRSTMIYP